LKQEVDVQEIDHRPKGERDAYKLLYAGFTAAPVIAGIDKFAGLMVAAKPKWGGYVVGAWLAGIVPNLWTKPEYRDVALRDIGLALGALALARLAADVPQERRMVELPA
jgi:hypothetical protein